MIFSLSGIFWLVLLGFMVHFWVKQYRGWKAEGGGFPAGKKTRERTKEYDAFNDDPAMRQHPSYGNGPVQQSTVDAMITDFSIMLAQESRKSKAPIDDEDDGNSGLAGV